MEQKGALKTLAELAADQSGLVTAAQATEAGVPRPSLSRLTKAGRLEMVGRGVYLVEGAQQPEHLPIWVAWLRLNPSTMAWRRSGLGKDDGVVSHRSATVLHDLGDIPADNVELSVPHRRTTRELGVRLLVRPDLTSSDVTRVAGMPVTTAERTVVDLLRDRADGGHVGAVIADATQRGLVDVDSLAERVGDFASAYGMAGASGRELLSALADRADRQLEADQVRDVADLAALLAYTAGAEDAQRRFATDVILKTAVGETMAAQVKGSAAGHLAEQLSARGAVAESLLMALRDSSADRRIKNTTESAALRDAIRNQLSVAPAVAQAMEASSVLNRILAVDPSVTKSLLEASRAISEQMSGPAARAAALAALLRATASPTEVAETVSALVELTKGGESSDASSAVDSAEDGPDGHPAGQHGAIAA